MKPERMAEIKVAEAAASNELREEVYCADPSTKECVDAIPDLLAHIEELEGEVVRLGWEVEQTNLRWCETLARADTLAAENVALVEKVKHLNEQNAALAATGVTAQEWIRRENAALRERLNMTMPDMEKRDAEIIARAEKARADLADTESELEAVTQAGNKWMKQFIPAGMYDEHDHDEQGEALQRWRKYWDKREAVIERTITLMCEDKCSHNCCSHEARAMLAAVSVTPEALRELTPEEAATCPGLTDEQIIEALEKGWDESGFGDHKPAPVTHLPDVALEKVREQVRGSLRKSGLLKPATEGGEE